MPATSCKYRGHKEKCLMKDKFPVTKGGRLSCKRVRSAETYGSKGNRLSTLKANGLCYYVHKCGIKKSKVCK